MEQSRTVQVAARIVETAAGPARKSVKINMLNPSAACSALGPKPSLLVPRHQNGVPVDQNVRGVSGDQAKTKIVNADCGAQFTGLAFTPLTGTKRGIAISMDGGMSSRPVRRATHP